MNQSKGLDLSKIKMSLVFIRKLVGVQLYFWSYMLMTFYCLGMISLPYRVSSLGKGSVSQ